jgi:anti-sigma regulatory factor (Ser/Thr protein kinase)
LNGNFSELERLTAAVADFCAANSLDDDAGFQLNLVLEELFVNAVRYGGCEGGGLGIHLVRQIMRDVHYERDGEWNQLRMRRPAAQPDPSENRKGQ